MRKLNENGPLVSVIMGVYNCELTLESSVESIISQTYINWEYIICDDGSTDKTLEIAKNLSCKDNRIKVINNNENRRLAYTLNHCLEYAKGKYIARMDADDISLPDRFEKQITFLEAHPEYDVVGCARIIFDERGEKGIRKSFEIPSKEQLLTDVPHAHPTIMMKKSVYEQLGGYTVSPETMRAEDLEMWFRFYHKGYCGYNLAEPLLKYHESESDYTKRSISAAIGTTRIFLKGYKLIGIPVYKYYYAFKPFLSAILPKRLVFKYHQHRFLS